MGAPQGLIGLQPFADPCCMNSIGYDEAKQWGPAERARRGQCGHPRGQRRHLPRRPPSRPKAAASIASQVERVPVPRMNQRRMTDDRRIGEKNVRNDVLRIHNRFRLPTMAATAAWLGVPAGLF
jgi:hypothetical protein